MEVPLFAVDAARRIERGQLGARTLVREYSRRIAEREPGVQAWEHLDLKDALKEARACDSGPRRGILHGIPIGVKDIIDVVGMPCRMGSPIYANHVSKADAAMVALARAAGAVVLGKTVTTELAWFHPGKTRNPHHSEYTPGGSSSGSAAAVAAGMVPIAFGTQTAGSVIRPAAYCGVVGFKPSFGLIPRAGIKSQSESLDTPGWMANCVADIALMAEALTWDSRFRLTAETVLPRIGLLRLPEHDQASESMREAIEETAKVFTASGAKVSVLPTPKAFNGLNAAQTVIQLFEAARSYFGEYSQHRDSLSLRLAGLLEEGRLISWERYRGAQSVVQTARATLPALFQNFDALLLPAAAGSAPHGLDATGDPVFNRATTALHLPALTLPHFKDVNQLPLGIQLLALDDARLLGVGLWAETLLARH